LNHLSYQFPLHPYFNLLRDDISVTATAARVGETLTLHFQVGGNLTELVIPAQAAVVTRQHELWQTTCFECFFKETGKLSYWELNISPSGCWNLYQFSGYRQAMAEETLVASIQSTFSQHDGQISVHCVLPLDALIAPDSLLRVGLSCVLEYSAGKKDFWALQHPSDKPDFHHPESLSLVLPS